MSGDPDPNNPPVPVIIGPVAAYNDKNDPLKIYRTFASAGEFTKSLSSKLGVIEPHFDQEKLTKEMIQVGRATHFANTIGDTTEAIVSATRVFADKNSSDLAKAAAVMKCIAKASQIAALLGPYAVLATAVLGMISTILDSTGPQSKSMIEQLEGLMRTLMGETTQSEVKASARMLERQIDALNGYADVSMNWEMILQIAPLTSGISQFKILAASEWLFRPENQDNPVWEEVFVSHAEAMKKVNELLMKVQQKLNPNDIGFKSFQKVANVIRDDFWYQRNKFAVKINRIGHFRCVGTDQLAYMSETLGDPNHWGRDDGGRFASIALVRTSSDVSTDKGRVPSWGAYTDHRIGSGTLRNDMTMNEQQLGCLDIGVDPIQVTGEPYAYYLLITTRGSDFARKGRLVIHGAKAPPNDGKFDEASETVFNDWSKGFMYKNIDWNLFMARSFNAAIKQADGKAKTTKCVYLLASAPNELSHLAYVEWADLQAGKSQQVKVSQHMLVSGRRIAVSGKLVFFQNETGSIVYCTHDDFVDASEADFTNKPQSKVTVEPNKTPKLGSLRDMFAVSDERLLVVPDSGDMWDVRLKEENTTREMSRKLKDDVWSWTKINGTADRIAFTESPPVTMWEGLSELCKDIPPEKTVA